MSAHSPKASEPAPPLLRAARAVAVCILVLALTNCAARQGLELPELSDWELRRAVLAQTNRWEFSGRIGVSAADTGFNGKLWWWQRDDIFRATVGGPLGVGTIRVDGEGAGITVTDGDGQVTKMQDAEVELRQKYGWTIPIGSLRYWTLGIPDPALPADIELNADDQLARLQQGGWIVDITDYREGGGQQMPRRITAVNDDAKVRLIIDRWLFY